MIEANHNLDSSTVFGRVMLVFFWGGLSANVIIVLYTFFTNLNPVIILSISWGTVFINMLLIWLKNFIFGVFNGKKDGR